MTQNTSPDAAAALPDGAAAKKEYHSGTHRLISPEETLASVRRFFPVLGITRVADITGLDFAGLPVVSVCRPNSRSVVVSLGKGHDLAAARASGVMESIEAFMAERITQPLLLGSVNDLRFSHRLIDVDALPRTTNSLYHPDAPILWIEGQELITGTAAWVPYEMVHTAYTLPTPTGTGCFLATSNGLASGNHPLEAISHGICETVERDAATLHSLLTPGAAVLRRIDPSTVRDTDCRQVLDRLDRAGLHASIWNITSDVGIPAFRCLIAETPGQRPVRTAHNFEGMGCHPNRGIALLRGLTEAVQSRVATLAGVRDEPPPWDDTPAARMRADLRATPASGKTGARDADAASRADPAGRATADGRADDAAGDFSAVPQFESDNLGADVAWELSALRAAGVVEVVAVDLTREEFGIPVVRVITAGLEGPANLAASYRPGRRAMDLIGSR
jgi:YcaO-like protein with predicted kinase domain